MRGGEREGDWEWKGKRKGRGEWRRSIGSWRVTGKQGKAPTASKICTFQRLNFSLLHFIWQNDNVTQEPI